MRLCFDIWWVTHATKVLRFQISGIHYQGKSFVVLVAGLGLKVFTAIATPMSSPLCFHSTWMCVSGGWMSWGTWILGTAHRVKGENRANARGKAVTDMLRDCWWPRLLQIPLETTQVGRNCDFDADDSEMRMQAFALFAGPSNSKFTAEDVFAHLQHVGSRSNKGFNKMNKCPIVSLTFFSSIVFVLNVAVCVQHGCNDCLRVGFAIQLWLNDTSHLDLQQQS